MKRFLVALLAGAMVFGAVFGLAASLDVDGGTIQAGSDTDLQCDEDGVRVDGWGLETDDGLVYFVRIHDIDDDCSSNDLFVNITDEGVKVAEGSAHIPDDGTGEDDDPDTGQVGVKVYLDPDPAAEDVTDIEVFIEGGVGG